MKTDGILKPEELPFPVSQCLADDINNLIAALQRDDRDLDCFLNEVEGSARELDDENDNWVRQYYCRFGWMKGLPDAS